MTRPVVTPQVGGSVPKIAGQKPFKEVLESVKPQVSSRVHLKPVESSRFKPVSNTGKHPQIVSHRELDKPKKIEFKIKGSSSASKSRIRELSANRA